MLKSKIFWSVSIAIAVVVMAGEIAVQRVYQSEMEVLIVPKNEVTANSINQIVENGRQVATSLSFYNNLIKDNSGIIDESKDLSADQRKSFWNSRMNIRPVEKSGVLKITVRDKNKNAAENLARVSAQELASSMSQFYNIKTDVDIRFHDSMKPLPAPRDRALVPEAGKAKQ